MRHHEGPIRWGIAGTGNIAGKFADSFPLLGEGELVAVASHDPDRARAFAERHGIGRAVADIDELADAPDVDAVYVAGLHPVHMPHTVRFLEAGKHVLVEKPMALDAAQVDAMLAAARRADRFLMEALWMRFNPAPVEAVRRIRAGEIGEVRRIFADFSFARPYTPDHRLWDRAKGGGALLDLGIYPLSLAWWLLGPPSSIEATGHVGDPGVDDEVNLFASWPSGATALLTAGLRLPGTMAARIEGTEGAVALPMPFHATDRFTVHRTGGTGRDGEEQVVAEPAGLHHQVGEVHRCLRAGERESPRLPNGTSRDVVAAMDDVRAALGVRYDT